MELVVNLEEMIFSKNDFITKSVEYEKQAICSSCNGTREEGGAKSSTCYSCKGKGVKIDPLFRKESRCNTCKGHGYIVKNPCNSCCGTGLQTKTVSYELKL